MKSIVILIAFLLFIQVAFAAESFCGSSTSASCSSDLDCKKGGCSNQVCEGKNENTTTTCEFRECYDATKYNLSCKCVSNKCQWSSDVGQSWTSSSIVNTLKGVFSFLTSINPFILLIFGIILVIVSKLAKFVGIILIIFAIIYLVLSLIR